MFFAITVQGISALFSAAVVVEMIRQAWLRDATWDDWKHFAIVGIIWVPIFALGITGLYLMRQSVGAT